MKKNNLQFIVFELITFFIMIIVIGIVWVFLYAVQTRYCEKVEEEMGIALKSHWAQGCLHLDTTSNEWVISPHGFNRQ